MAKVYLTVLVLFGRVTVEKPVRREGRTRHAVRRMSPVIGAIYNPCT